MSFPANSFDTYPLPPRGHGRHRSGRGQGESFFFSQNRSFPSPGGRDNYTGRSRGHDFGYGRDGFSKHNPEASAIQVPTSSKGARRSNHDYSGATFPRHDDSFSSANTSRHFSTGTINPQANPFISNNVPGQQHHLSAQSAVISAPQAPRFFRGIPTKDQMSRKEFHNSKRSGNMRHLGAFPRWDGSFPAQVGSGASNQTPTYLRYTGNGYTGLAPFLSHPVWGYSIGFYPSDMHLTHSDFYAQARLNRNNNTPAAITWALHSNYGALSTITPGYDGNMHGYFPFIPEDHFIWYGDQGASHYVFPDFPSSDPLNAEQPRRQSSFNANARDFVPAASSTVGLYGGHRDSRLLRQTYRALDSVAPPIVGCTPDDKVHTANSAPGSRLHRGGPTRSDWFIDDSLVDIETDMKHVALSIAPICERSMQGGGDSPRWS